MENLKNPRMIIKGDFWDSYLYRDCLFLFSTNGSVDVFDWFYLVQRNAKSDTLLGLKCAFLRSDYLYKIRDDDLFTDRELKKLVKRKINLLNDIEFGLDDVAKKCSIQFHQPPIDIGFYNNIIFYIDSRGFFSRELKFKNKNVISKSERMISKIVSQNISVGSSGRILLSAADKGVFEYDPRFLDYEGYECVSRDFDHEECIYQISKEHSTNCDWAYSTIVNNSYFEKPHIFPFKYEKNIGNQYELKPLNRIKSEFLFSDIDIENCVICANNEKIYCVHSDRIDGYRYIQTNVDSEEESFQKIDTVPVDLGGKIVASEVTEFGIVIETEASLFVLESSGSLTKINNSPKEVIKWRVFSRSNCYANQLHVIYKDRLEILSFNSDAFRDKAQFKAIGNMHPKKMY